MRKILEVSLQQESDVQQAIDLNKKQEEGDRFIIKASSDNLVDTRCIIMLLHAKYTVTTDGRYLQFIKQ